MKGYEIQKITPDIMTGFTDKTGRDIHIGDIVQHRLGKFNKASAGPSRTVVSRYGKKIVLAPESQPDSLASSATLNKSIAQYLTIIDCAHLR